MSSTDGIRSAGPTVLVIEPDPAAALRIGGCLMCAGLESHVIASGQQADRAAGDVGWAAAVINTDTPGLATDRLVERLQLDLDVPVVLLGRFADESERVGWLNRGVDDFVPPPSSPDEVVARVCSVLRRGRPHHDEPPITVGPLDEATRRGPGVRATGVALADGVQAPPPPGGRARPCLLTRGTAPRRLGYTTGGDATVTVHVQTVRAKLEPGAGRSRLIRTLRGVGYYLDLTAA